MFAQMSGWDTFCLITLATLFVMGYALRKFVNQAKAAINSPLGAAAAKSGLSLFLGRLFR
jgi:hypothetical protein